jgi:hypothetical protein
MAAGKRNENEEFESYRARLKAEAAALKKYLQGVFIHVSCILVKNKKTDKMMKVQAMGTYVKKQTFRKGKVVR